MWVCVCVSSTGHFVCVCVCVLYFSSIKFHELLVQLEEKLVLKIL